MESRTYASRKAKDPEWAKKMADRVCATRRKNMALLKAEAGGKCVVCGYNRCAAALEFHHIDPTVKEGGVIGTTASLAKQRTEAAKCVLLCSNCHREAHHSTLEIHSPIAQLADASDC
jgi:hypothetical protein